MKQQAIIDLAAEPRQELREAAPLVVPPLPDTFLGLIGRLAENPTVTVEVMERLLAMQERVQAGERKAAFDAAFAEMQGDIPIITERGEIVVGGQVRSKYARLEDILREVRPILQRHGFALRFRSSVCEDKRLKVTGILSHRSGHSEEDEFVSAPDSSGSKNDIQAIGSARSYGQRYCTVSLLNIGTQGEDDDGASSQRPKTPEAVAALLKRLKDAAPNGMPALMSIWAQADENTRRFVTQHYTNEYRQLRAEADKVKA